MYMYIYLSTYLSIYLYAPSIEKYVAKPSFIEIANALNTLQNLCLFHEVGKICQSFCKD